MNEIPLPLTYTRASVQQNYLPLGGIVYENENVSVQTTAMKCECTPNHETSAALRIVITGGSAGIGQSLVQEFARAGHHVLFTYLQSVESSETLTAQFPNTHRVRLDQGNLQSVLEFAAQTDVWAAGHGVDVLINNAALGSATVRKYVERTHTPTENPLPEARNPDYSGENPIAHCKTNGRAPAHTFPNDMATNLAILSRRAAEDEALMRVNALGPLWVSDALMPLLRQAASASTPRRAHATIIFIGSVGGGSSAVFPEYRASDLMGKAAVTYLSKHLAAEHVRDEVDVFCISPGATETDMFRESTLSRLTNVDRFIDEMPKRRLIQPSEIAKTVLWLATSPSSRILHGSVIDASLGLAVRPGLQTEADST